MAYYIAHSSGQWKNHKYTKIVNGRYIYDKDSSGNLKKTASNVRKLANAKRDLKNPRSSVTTDRTSRIAEDAALYRKNLTDKKKEFDAKVEAAKQKAKDTYNDRIKKTQKFYMNLKASVEDSKKFTDANAKAKVLGRSKVNKKTVDDAYKKLAKAKKVYSIYMDNRASFPNFKKSGVKEAAQAYKQAYNEYMIYLRTYESKFGQRVKKAVKEYRLNKKYGGK